MWWIWVLIAVASLPVVLVLGMWAVGRGLPVAHISAASIDLNQPPDAVWDLITDVSRYPEWSRIRKVERLPDQDGQPLWRQHFGRNSVVTRDSRAIKPVAYEQTIADDAKFFSGTWLYEIMPREVLTAAGPQQACTLRLTEHGRVHPAIPRFMMHYLVDPAKYLKQQLRSVAESFNDPAAVRLLSTTRRGATAGEAVLEAFESSDGAGPPDRTP